MDRIIVRSKIGNDGILHLDVPVGKADANQEVHVTIEPNAGAFSKPLTISAAELLQSELVGIWADRADIGDSREFARRLREEAQTRRARA